MKYEIRLLPAVKPKYRGLTFEEFEINKRWKLESFSINFYEMRTFGLMTGDRNPLHFDHEFCAKIGWYRKPVVHGLAVISWAMGAVHKSGLIEGTCLGLLTGKISFARPVYPEEKIFSELVAVAKEEKRKAGLVSFDLLITKNEGKDNKPMRRLVAEVGFSVLVKKRGQ